MKCPFCAYLEDKVVDSRESRDGDAIRVETIDGTAVHLGAGERPAERRP